MLAMNAMRRMGPSYDSLGAGASARAILHALRESGLGAASGGTPLEVQREAESPPRLESATPIEGAGIVARRVEGEPVVGFGAFLDGIQRSMVRAHHAGVPIVHGGVAAAIRIRVARRMRVWETPVRSHACYLPMALLDPDVVAALAARCPVVDTLADQAAGTPVPLHPGDLSARALTTVQRAREAAEGSLAEAWIARGTTPLLMDGGIAGRETVARSALVAGAVKSHRTLYVTGESLPVIVALREGERTTAVALTSPRRTPVATWYLRLRDPGARGPFFGLVRVEVAHEDAATVTARADLVSRWLLAERTPVALPDTRWDVMVYGIRECEQYLTSIL
jgi:hypothetical protein